jgi:hypothetical protein
MSQTTTRTTIIVPTSPKPSIPFLLSKPSRVFHLPSPASDAGLVPRHQCGGIAEKDNIESLAVLTVCSQTTIHGRAYVANRDMSTFEQTGRRCP